MPRQTRAHARRARRSRPARRPWALVALLVMAGAALAAAWAVPGRVSLTDPPRLPQEPPDLGAEPVSKHVRRMAGDDRTATSVAVSRATFADGAEHAVLASAGDYPDALAGAALAGARGGPVLLTAGDELPPPVRDELGWLQPERVTILGGEQAVSPAVAGQLDRLGVDRVSRFAGGTRFDTAAATARAVTGGDGEHAYVVAAEGWPDAVTVSALAAHEPAPVLLSGSETLPEATAEAIADLGFETLTIVGGRAAVSEEVRAELAELAGSVRRVAGANRYATSRAVAELGAEHGLDGTRPWLVTGRDWPDALVAGAAAAWTGQPLVLVDGADLDVSPATQRWLLDEPRPERTTLVGGEGAVGSSVAADLTSLSALAGEPHRVAAAGDIACDPRWRGWAVATGCRHSDTAELAEHADDLLALGDIQSGHTTLANLSDTYDPTWGRFKDRTHPTLGKHDYTGGDAAEYFAYFGEQAGPEGRGYYEREIGGWQVLSLNSNCYQPGVGCEPGSEQLEWLRQTLAASEAECRLAFMHHARYSDGATHGDHRRLEPMWEVLDEGGVDVVLAAHAHLYERLRRADAHGTADPAGGIRSFVVGTGGTSLRSFAGRQPLSVARTSEHFGVLELDLYASGYTWRFQPLNEAGFDTGATFTDRGFGGCG